MRKSPIKALKSKDTSISRFIGLTLPIKMGNTYPVILVP